MTKKKKKRDFFFKEKINICIKVTAKPRIYSSTELYNHRNLFAGDTGH